MVLRLKAVGRAAAMPWPLLHTHGADVLPAAFWEDCRISYKGQLPALPYECARAGPQKPQLPGDLCVKPQASGKGSCP